VIALDKVTKTYGRKAAPVAAVRELSLTVERGEFVVITGRSGSGKTTLLNLVAGLARPTAGRVTLEGVDLWQLPDGEQSLFRNRKIGFVFQFPSLMPALSSLENVMLPRLFGPRDRRAGARERATHLLEEVGLGDKLHALPRELSGGQQQRVVVARALVNEPELLLADEPTSNLDDATEQEIMGLFRDIHARTGLTVLVVTHAVELGRFGTRGVEMAEGRIADAGRGE
jgi:ABC-type lipoprotein export system ATPase subunit